MPQDSQPESLTSNLAVSNQPALPNEERLSLMAVWRVLMKRRFIIIGSTILFFAIAAYNSFRAKPVFESVSRVEITPNSMATGLQSAMDQAKIGEGNNPLQTEILILQSDSVMFETARSLNLIDRLRSSQAQEGKAGAPVATGDITPIERRALIGMIRGGLKVSVVAGTQMVDIRYHGTDPSLGPEIINSLVDTYIDHDLKTEFDHTTHVSDWLEKRLATLREDASNAQRRLADYERKHNIVGAANESSSLNLANLTQISAAYQSAEVEKIVKEARLRGFESKDSDLASVTGDDPVVAGLRARLSDLTLQRAQLTRLGEKHPKIVDLDAQIQRVQAAIDQEIGLSKRQIADEFANSTRVEEGLRHRLDAQKDELYRLNEDVAEYVILRHDAELNRSLYDTLQMRLKEASVTAGLAATNITVVDRAEVPLVPVGPNRRMNTILGLLGGLIVGVVIAFTVESIDDTLQTSEEVESESSLPAMATIPHIFGETEMRKRNPQLTGATGSYAPQLVALTNSKSNAAEAYRNLRSSLLLSSIDRSPQVVLLTSSFPGEGKTTTALNIAIVLAQRGERVLLIDADLRRGTLERVLNVKDRGFGLSSILSDPLTTENIERPIQELPNLHVLPTGPRPPNPAEMLSSQRLIDQIQSWRQEFDRIVLDSAPLLAVSDSRSLSKIADAVILVARARITRKRALLRARDLLLRVNAPVSGVVVNDVDLRLENFYTSRYGLYGYSYGYRYRYGRSYSDNAYGFEDEEKDETHAKK